MSRSVAGAASAGRTWPAPEGAPVDARRWWGSDRGGWPAGERGGATLIGLALTGS